MMGPGGFEPPTVWLKARNSTWLSYGPALLLNPFAEWSEYIILPAGRDLSKPALAKAPAGLSPSGSTWMLGI